MSRELTKMNLIAIVQQLPKDDIEVIQTYISMIEQENNQLKEQLKDEEELRIKIAKDRERTYKDCLLLIEQKKELRSWLEEQCIQYGKYERWQFEETLDKLNELTGKEK